MVQAQERAEYAAERARLLLGCYRTGDANDPETYVAAIAAILSRYPAWVVTSVTHPATGLPSQKNWLPTVKEVTDACVSIMEPVIEREARSQRVRDQIAERERFESMPKPSLKDLQAKYGKNFGLGVEEAKRISLPAPNIDQLRSHYAHYNLEFKSKNVDELTEHDCC